MSMGTGAEASPADSDRRQRLWQDLDKLRLAIGLAAAPVLPVVIGLGLNILSHVPAPGRQDTPSVLTSFVWMTGTVEIWSIAFGVFYLITSPRRSGLITRANCIFIGGLAAVLFPAVFTVFLAALVIVVNPNVAHFPLVMLPWKLMVGLFLTPLGMLGGWIFWRIGVAPAKPPLGQINRVFE